MKKQSKRTLAIETIFVKDGMFLANDGRLYRYQIEKGIVQVYEKACATNVKTEKVFLFEDSRTESSFWLVKKDNQTVFFKKSDGTFEAVYSRWCSRGGNYYPLVYGDVLFVVADLCWANTNPCRESMEPTYKVFRARKDGSGYDDITLTITESKYYRITEICESTVC